MGHDIPETNSDDLNNSNRISKQTHENGWVIMKEGKEQRL